MTGRPLEGVRILAVEQFGAGPYGTMALADLGAEVIKIEDPTTRGDVSRTVPPYRLTETDSIYFQALNRNKKSLVLDIRPREGREVFHRLVQVSEAVYNNLRGDVPRKIGITYETLKAVNPKIVCCSLTGFGMTGPRAAEPGYDYLMQGYAGLMSITGEPGAPPAKFGVSVIDLCGGYVSALGLVAAVVRARATGMGCDVDVALLDTAVSLLNYLGVWHLNRGYMPTKLADSAHASLVPSQVFPSKDGHIIVMCFKEKFWQELCEILGAPHLAEDPRFKTFDERLPNREVLVPILKDLFRKRTTAEWLEALRGRVPCGPVYDVAHALMDEQVLARGMVLDVPHPAEGTLKQIACPIQVPGTEHPRLPGPQYGEHTAAVLREYLGMADEEIAALAARGVVSVGDGAGVVAPPPRAPEAG
jgi:crotonobetainyl-CoA:carnitine CoA-transferase CaiB-like acyl-CoA transferase